MILPTLFHAIIFCLISLVIGILVISICFHLIFKPDFRPGKNSMPFLWYPLLTTIHRHSKKKLASVQTYIMETLSGLCKMCEDQKICCFSLLNQKFVILFTADTAAVILRSNKFTEKSVFNKRTIPMLKDGLFISNGKKWQIRRKLLTPTFHFKILQDFVPLVGKVSKNILPKLNTPDQSWVNIIEMMKICSLDILMQTALGVDVDPQSKDAIGCIKALDKYIEYMSERATRPWIDKFFRLTSLAKKSDECIQTVHTFLTKVIVEKKKRRLYYMQNVSKDEEISKEKGNSEVQDIAILPKSKRKAFMDFLLELHLEDGSLTEEHIMEETISFFQGTTVAFGNAISYAMYCIGLYKEEQKKIHNELDEIFGNSDRDITEEDLKSMKYLECAIKEALRLYPLLYVARTAPEDIKIDDYTIDKGSIVVISIHMIHRDPQVYPDPEKFDPSRFFPENYQKIPAYAYVPFSAGPRNCIAQRFAMLEMKTIISTILRKYTAHSLDERDKVFRVSKYFPLRMSFTPRTFSNHKCEQKKFL